MFKKERVCIAFPPHPSLHHVLESEACNNASKSPINASKSFLRQKKSAAFTRVVKSFLRHFLIMPRKLPFEANLSASNDIPFEAPLD